MLIDASSDIIFALDRDLRVTAINAAGAASLGITVKEARGRRIDELGIPEETRQRWERRCRDVLASGQPAERLLNEFTLADGRRHLNETSLWPIVAADGEVVGVNGGSRDISETAQAEEMLRVSEQRYRTLFHCANDGIVVHDLDGRILDANRVMSGRLGLNPEDLVGMSISDIRTPEAAALYPEYVEEICKQGRVVVETLHRAGEGKSVPVEVSARLIEGGPRPLVLSISRDIAEHKRAEQERAGEIRLKDFLIELYAKGSGLTDADLCDYVLEQVVGLTDSMIGFLHVVSDDQNHIDLTTWNREATKGCAVSEWTHGSIQLAGNWADSVRSGRPAVYNDFAQSANQKGLPDGHVPVRRLLSVPVIEEGKTRMVFGVGNKAEDYDESDVARVQVVASALQRVVGQRRAEALLRQSEAKYNRFFKTSRDCVFITSRDGTIVDMNDASLELFGYSSLDELLGVNVTSFYADPEVRDRYLALVERQGYTFEYPVEGRKKDGSVVHALLTSVAIRDDENRLSGFQGTIHNVTERKQIEESLRLTQLSVEEAADLIYWLDATGRILLANNVCCRRHGYSRDELLTMTIRDLDPTMSANAWASRWQELTERGSLHLESTHQTKDGEVFPIEITSNYVECEGREYNFVFARDITERREAERVIKERDDQLRQAQKMEAVGQLAGGIAHDFNNLLTAIIGYSDLVLTSEEGIDESLREDVGEIKAAAGRASDLTRQILAFSRRQALRPEALCINEIIARIERLLRRTLGENIDVVTLLQPDLGLVEVDGSQFEQVLMNLAVNARDAMPMGGS